VTYFLPLLACCFSCGPEPDFITRQGLLVYTNGLKVKQRNVELAIDLTALAAASVDVENYSVEKLEALFHKYDSRVSIYFVKMQEGDIGTCPNEGDPDRRCLGIPCRHTASKSGWCMGLWNSNFLSMTVVHMKCLGHSALVHELVHMYNFLAERRNDSDHIDGRFFPTGCWGKGVDHTSCQRKSVLYRGTVMLQKLLCSVSD